MKVELNVPKEYEGFIKLSSKEWKDSFRRAFLEALENTVKQEVAFKSVKKLAGKSKLTDKKALELGEELKRNIARRHGL